MKSPKFKIGDHVAFKTNSASGNIRNNYVVKGILAPGQKISQEADYPGWSIREYVNNTNETVYICPDPMCGITFTFKESEIKTV